MISILISFFFGAFQALMLKKLLFYFTKENYIKAIAFIIIKLLSYGAALAVLLILCSDCIINCAIGFSLGLPISVTAWFLYNAIIQKSPSSGDDYNENNNNN